ncbi:MAG: (2Fe-2S) ferredoxin domain-containing protein [Armatimonadota bacterium]
MGTVQKALAQVKKKASSVRQKRLDGVTSRIIVGTATCGISAGAKTVVDALNQEITARNLKGVAVTETGCSGRCDLEPLVQVLKDGEAPIMYFHITPEKARRIIQQHVQNNEVITEWALL